MSSPLPYYLPTPVFESSWTSLSDGIKSSWYSKLTDELHRAWKGPGWNPKMVHLEGDTYAIDVCSTNLQGKYVVGLHSAWVIEYVDHPFLETLNKLPNVPRVIKSTYKKEVRLRFTRASEHFPYLTHMSKADSAWQEYLERTGLDYE